MFCLVWWWIWIASPEGPEDQQWHIQSAAWIHLKPLPTLFTKQFYIIYGYVWAHTWFASWNTWPCMWSNCQKGFILWELCSYVYFQLIQLTVVFSCVNSFTYASETKYHKKWQSSQMIVSTMSMVWCGKVYGNYWVDIVEQENIQGQCNPRKQCVYKDRKGGVSFFV